MNITNDNQYVININGLTGSQGPTGATGPLPVLGATGSYDYLTTFNGANTVITSDKNLFIQKPSTAYIQLHNLSGPSSVSSEISLIHAGSASNLIIGANYANLLMPEMYIGSYGPAALKVFINSTEILRFPSVGITLNNASSTILCINGTVIEKRLVSSLPTNTGPTGPQGTAGAIGPTGTQGIQGIDGPTGPNGLKNIAFFTVAQNATTTTIANNVTYYSLIAPGIVGAALYTFNAGFSYVGTSNMLLFQYIGANGANIFFELILSISSASNNDVIELSCWQSPVFTGLTVTGGSILSIVQENLTSTSLRSNPLALTCCAVNVPTNTQFVFACRVLLGAGPSSVTARNVSLKCTSI